MTDPTATAIAAQLRRFWWLPVLRGILLLGLGLFMVFKPFDTLTALVWLIGLFTIVDGVLTIISAFLDKRDTGVLWPVVGGLVTIAIGVVLLAWPGPTVKVLFYLTAFWVILLGVVGIIGSIVSHKRDNPTWFFPLILGLISLMIGLLLVTNPQTSIAVVMLLVGLFALVAGVVLVVGGFAARSIAATIEDDAKKVIEL
ncbi:HdeD family acid-resistance protein [Cellulomonas edaphi]|uniref:DUF308 domain-containing protein n=1 Tax=Cellulomonas edaphi TaxID=3053468 RepID=A0ABT7S4S8_9CELL|nr:DUF308 domain-containing protein [Cellulomons edaphi]MDM7830032.1 DUF308 domain-containing protein [Cellulomons edaphi]